MYVKIVKGSKEDIRECKRVRYEPCCIERDPTLTHAELIFDNSETFEFECKEIEIYFLNDEGKTIDCKRWWNPPKGTKILTSEGVLEPEMITTERPRTSYAGPVVGNRSK